MGYATLQILGGLVFLAVGGEVVFRGALALAVRLRLTPAVIGLTVMAVVTSLPELATSVVAQVENSPDMSLGNIVGSNTFNIGAVLGLCGLIRALAIPGTMVRLEWPFMFVASCLLLLLARDGEIDRLEGGFFFVGFVLFTGFMVRLARIEVGREEEQTFREALEEATGAPTSREPPLYRPLALVVCGGAALWFGAEFLITGARTVAVHFGVEERVIAVTVVAAGTGLPEFVATLVAVLHRRTDMAVGNIIGSNIANILLIGGIASLVRPLIVNPAILDGDLWWMLGVSLALGPFLRGNVLTRGEAFLLLAAYGVYLWTLFGRSA